MNPIVRTIYRSNVWAFPVFVLVFCAANGLFVKDRIPSNQILLASLLFAIYYNWVYYVVLNVYRGGRKKRIIAGVALVILLLTIEPTLEFLIYTCFPSMDVYFDKYMLEKDYVHDISEFRQRWITALLVIFFAVIIRLAFRLNRNKTIEAEESKKQKAKQDEEIKTLHDRLKARQLNTHFIENFVLIALHREKKQNKENVEMLTMLTDLMNYQLSMDNQQQTTNWQEEWDQVENLLQMAYYKDANFVYEWAHDDGIADLEMVIPHGLLLMPLENALKYGRNTAAWPLRMEFSRKDNRIYIRYTNYFDPVVRDRIKSTGKGFKLMETRIAAGAWPIILRKSEVDNLFWVDIEIAC
ncbi:LytS family sensor histidine kinase [Sphingobacterium haloxyli]|uniref:Signal transduction histidine kinase internal region domain-containing protein n=1 Tax=Sphingobacterium haloxyli TaxID=2100533 RepID=A0A2S9IYD6_9SPHI|nr:hypothetical protein [Sphingobacterium haloxyli]PRD45537.1 hypothetical protein C5745_17645 [Sphingobacterium haloxyli]